MEPVLIAVEECNRYFIVQQRWGIDGPDGCSDSWHADDPKRPTFECAYVFHPMAGPYARVYREWCNFDARNKTHRSFGYIVEARTKRQVVDKMVELGHPAMFNSKFYYPESQIMTSEYDGTSAVFLDPDPEIVALTRTIERAQAKIDFLASLPSEPAVDEDGVAVIYFRKKFSRGGRPYDYAAIKAGDGKWYTTGPASPKGYTWAMLIKWMIDGHPDIEILVATEWVTL